MGRVSVLQAIRKRLAKSYARTSAGKIIKRDYDLAELFYHHERNVTGTADLHALLGELVEQPDRAIVLARPHPDHHPYPRQEPVARRSRSAAKLRDTRGKLHNLAKHGTDRRARQEQDIAAGRLVEVTAPPTYVAHSSDILPLDFDGAIAPAGIDWRELGLAWAADFLRRTLPPEFHDRTCVYCATASTADLTKASLGGDKIHMRLWFLADHGISAGQAKLWLGGVEHLDLATFHPVQLVYTARPLFEDGLLDPLPVRLGLLPGRHDRVTVPELVEPDDGGGEFGSFGRAVSAEGLGLLPSPRFEGVLERYAGEPGTTRKLLLQAAFAYARDVGRDRVDVLALAEALAEAVSPWRARRAVAGYGLPGLIEWAVERTPPDARDGQPAEPRQPHYPAQGKPPAEASREVLATLREFVDRALAWRREGMGKGETPPHVAIKGAAGLGKTQGLFETIATVQAETKRLLYVEHYAPNHGLTPELADIAGVKYGLRSLVIHGRDKDHCFKWEAAEKLGKFGADVGGTLCFDPKLKVACTHYFTCPYQLQYLDQAPGIRFFAHAYLYSRRNRNLPVPDFTTFDEGFWHGAVATPEFPLERLCAPERWKKNSGDDRQSAAIFAEMVFRTVDQGMDPRHGINAITAEQCAFMAAIEGRNLIRPDIHPGMPYAAQKALVNEWERHRQNGGGGAYRFWKQLELDCLTPHLPIQMLVLRRDAPRRGAKKKGEAAVERCDMMVVCFRKEIGGPPVESPDPEVEPGIRVLDLPVLALDASLDQRIAAKLLAGASHRTIEVQRHMWAIQVLDQTGSKSMLIGRTDAPEERARTAWRRRQVERFVEWLRRQGRKVLVVGFLDLVGNKDRKKPVEPLIEMHDDVGRLHFGKLRGHDSYKAYDTVVVVGRQQPRLEELEEMARALFGDEAAEEILKLLAPDAGGHLHLAKEWRRIRMADGSRHEAQVDVHPDPRVQAILEQVREREIEQAMDRLRLVYRPEPALVILLTNIVVDATINEVGTWDGLLGDRVAAHRERFGEVTPHSPSELARLAPDVWPTTNAAKLWLGRNEGSEGLNNIFKGSDPSFGVEYRLAGQRGSHPHRATVRLPATPGPPLPQRLRAALEAVVGEVATFRVMGRANPEPEQEDDADAEHDDAGDDQDGAPGQGGSAEWEADWAAAAGE